jgi:hypothetical protein
MIQKYLLMYIYKFVQAAYVQEYTFYGMHAIPRMSPG